MSDKKFTPKEAALMVLAKAQELYGASTLAKGDWNKIHNKLESEGYSKESADKIDGSIKAKMNKSDASQVIGANAPKGINRPTSKLGESHMGRSVRQGDSEGAKKVAFGTIKEQRNIPKPDLGKSEEEKEEKNPDEKADEALGEKVEQDVQEHEASNKDPEHHEKGSYKLAKFMGKMEMKKSMNKADGQTLGAAIGYPGAAQSAPAPAPSPEPMVNKAK